MKHTLCSFSSTDAADEPRQHTSTLAVIKTHSEHQFTLDNKDCAGRVKQYDLELSLQLIYIFINTYIKFLKFPINRIMLNFI